MKQIKRDIRKYLSTVALTFLSILLISCSDDDSNSPVPYITYTGVTTAAAIDNTNADVIAAAALGAVKSNAIPLNTGGTGASTSAVNIVAQLVATVLNDGAVGDDSIERSRATVNDYGTLPGSCGGNIFYTIALDDISFDFTMTMDFRNYCEAGFIFAGFANIIDGSTDMFISFLDFTMTGSNFVLQDTNRAETYLYENYTFVFLTSGPNLVFSVDGTFYHPVYGYIVLTTITPFEFSGASPYPFPGALEIVEDVVPADRAIFTSLSTIQYRLDIDLLNDTNIDQTITRNWADL